MRYDVGSNPAPRAILIRESYDESERRSNKIKSLQESIKESQKELEKLLKK